MEEFQEAFGDSPDILVAHGEDAEAGQDDYNSLSKFQGGDGAHAFDMGGVFYFGMRDVRLHLVKIEFWYPGHGRGFNSKGESDLVDAV